MRITRRMIGMMSGTSLDAIDLCCADFTTHVDHVHHVDHDDSWTYQLIAVESVPYSRDWIARLIEAPALSGQQLIKLHVDYGHVIGQTINRFVETHKLDDIDGVAVHGHTIFHQPENKMTFQLGDGETISAYVRCPVVSNFRSKDIALGGQGAPLVPVGEAHLFNQYQLCLNLGGIANLSVLEEGFTGDSVTRGTGKLKAAFDVCPCNMLLNMLAQRIETGARDFDENGETSASGQVVDAIIERLDSLEYYSRPPGPKSLGREWFEQNVQPVIDDVKSIPVKDLLRTVVEHISHQIAAAIQYYSAAYRFNDRKLSMLITGGGRHNSFLVDRIRQLVDVDLVDFDSPTDLVDFKEALIFAFLGVRRLVGLPNVDRMVTGATSDSVSGAVHHGWVGGWAVSQTGTRAQNDQYYE